LTIAAFCSEHSTMPSVLCSRSGALRPIEVIDVHLHLAEVLMGSVALSISNSRPGSGADATSTANVSVMRNDEDVKTRVRYRSDSANH